VGSRAECRLRSLGWLAAGARDAPVEGQWPARLQRGRVPLGRLVPSRRTRFSPHNLYTTGKQLRGIAAAQGARDAAIAWPWTFAPDLALRLRPTGGRIQVAYLANSIRYDYDRETNTYLRSVTGETKQIDAATHQPVAPKNVVIMLMTFGPLNDGSQKQRLEATVVGSGTAWIATNGTTIQGTWNKTALTSPTRFFDSAGQPVVLTVGQTFVQVMQTGTKVVLIPGTPPVLASRAIGQIPI
jgi:hypothetical protein